MGILIVLLIIYMVVLPIYLTILILKPNSFIPKKDRNTPKRVHAKIAPTSLSTPLNPYAQYQDKRTGLYIPRRNGGGVRMEAHE